MKIGSLFSGVGGLDLAVEAFFNAKTAWHVEIDPEPSKVLAARWPSIPNHGDITRIDWDTVEPVDILCGGFPCQDLSLAGRRAGMRPGTRSGLWADFKTAIATLRPSVVVIENVRGLLSGCAESDSDLEPCPGCVGITKQHRPVLRALGRVLGDLAALGFDAEWGSLRASDVGAPHGRFRVFVVAYARGVRLGSWWVAGPGETSGGWSSAVNRGHSRAPVTLLPTPTAQDSAASGGSSESDVTLTDAVVRTKLGSQPNSRLLPTPQVADADGGHASRSGERSGELLLPGIARALLPTPTTEPDTGNGHARNLGKEARLLPTPRAARGAASTETMYELGGERVDEGDIQGNVVGEVAWGDYEPAVRLWESLTRPAPAPTLPDGKNGNHRLSARLPEWMMGYSDGWVTDILDRNPAIRACGNGVSPQQAYAAITQLWARVILERAA